MKDGQLAVAFDLGATQVRAGIVRGGEVLKRAALKTDVSGGPRAVMAQFKQLLTVVSDGIDHTLIAAAGVCAPGPLDSKAGHVINISTLPGWNDFPLQKNVSQLLGLPVVLENDGIAAANGEWLFGAGRGYDNVVYVTVSTGIGGGVVSDGRLLRGRRGMAGHVGHLLMSPQGARCSCGAVGCFEAQASGTALGQKAREMRHLSPVLGLTDSNFIDARTVVEGARSGDKSCLQLLAEEARLLGYGFTSLLHLYSPDVIVMGGGVSNAFDLLHDDIVAEIDHQAMAPFRAVKLLKAELGDNCGLIGVAALAFEAVK